MSSSKYRHVVAYLFFGVLTTAVNIGAYALFTKGLNVGYLWANAIAWALAVAFAFVTNKLWVFESRSRSARVLAYEIATFTAARLASGALDEGTMFVLVGLMHVPDLWSKVAVNVIVVIANYVLSKLVVFRHAGSADSES